MANEGNQIENLFNDLDKLYTSLTIQHNHKQDILESNTLDYDKKDIELLTINNQIKYIEKQIVEQELMINDLVNSGVVEELTNSSILDEEITPSAPSILVTKDVGCQTGDYDEGAIRLICKHKDCINTVMFNSPFCVNHRKIVDECNIDYCTRKQYSNGLCWSHQFILHQ
jgi:hypothetical protein